MTQIFDWINLISRYVFNVSLELEDNLEFKSVYSESVLVKVTVHTQRSVSVPSFDNYICSCITTISEHGYIYNNHGFVLNKHGVICYGPCESIAKFKVLCNQLLNFALSNNLQTSSNPTMITVTFA